VKCDCDDEGIYEEPFEVFCAESYNNNNNNNNNCLNSPNNNISFDIKKQYENLGLSDNVSPPLFHSKHQHSLLKSPESFNGIDDDDDSNNDNNKNNKKKKNKDNNNNNINGGLEDEKKKNVLEITNRLAQIVEKKKCVNFNKKDEKTKLLNQSYKQSLDEKEKKTKGKKKIKKNIFKENEKLMIDILFYYKNELTEENYNVNKEK
jgi:hypothetical protein